MWPSSGFLAENSPEQDSFNINSITVGNGPVGFETHDLASTLYSSNSAACENIHNISM